MPSAEEPKILEHGGKRYISIRDFAAARNRTTQQVYTACSKGNGERTLRHETIVGRIMIDAEELTSYAFTKNEAVEMELHREIAALRRQLAFKDAKIAQLMNLLKQSNLVEDRAPEQATPDRSPA